jgi:glycyl-tRNA synthetase
MSYFDPVTNKKYVPYCVEPALGADRAALAFLCDAYDEETVGEDDVRTVLRFHPALAPVKVGVLPLSKKLSDAAYAVYRELSRGIVCEFDETGSIGKRYRRQDEIGTPYGVTYDFESENDKSVTIRERDSMEQERIRIDGLADWFKGKFSF